MKIVTGLLSLVLLVTLSGCVQTNDASCGNGACGEAGTESHFGVNLGNLDYNAAAGYIGELGSQVYVRDGRTPWHEEFGWKHIKNQDLVGACRVSCDPSRSPCNCRIGDFYFSSPAARTPLPPIASNRFLNFEAGRYDNAQPTGKKDLTPAFPRGHENAYISYLDYLLQSYKDTAKYWEVGNEAEASAFWAGTPQEYANLVVIASRQIKQSCVDCKVGISFAHPGLSPKRPELNEEWYRAIGGVCDTFDFIDAHFYDTRYIVPGQLDRLKQTCPGKEFISTETGIPDNTGYPTPQTAGGSPQKQAEDLTKYNTLMFADGYNKIFWYLVDTDYGMGSIFLHNGLIEEAALTKKPAFAAYKTMISKVDYFTWVSKIGEGQFRYDFADSSSVYVLWCAVDRCSVPPEISGTARVTDHLGNEETRDASQIILTGSPVFVQNT